MPCGNLTDVFQEGILREALNRATGRYVDAEDASDAPWLFVCPECRAPVSLRAGGSKRPYFAHMPGRSGRDCDLYVEGVAYGAGVTAVDFRDGNRVWEISLCLRLADTRASQGWGLELMVPTAGLPGLEIGVDVGGRTELVRCISDSEFFKSVIAEPQSKSYEIVSVSSNHTTIATHLRRTCLGLAADRATVFGEVNRPGSQLAVRTNELRIGRTYAFVWPSTITPTFPEELERVPLRSRSGWDATLVTLSHPLQSEVQAWIQRFTGLTLSVSLPEIVPVWPPLLRKVTGNFLEATQNSAISFFVGRLLPSGTMGAGALFARSSKAEDVGAGAVNISEPFFRLSSSGDPFVELTCQNPERAQLVVDFTLRSEYSVAAAVEIVGTDAHGAVKVIGLHNQIATDWIRDIRQGDAELSYLSLPPHVSGVLYTGQDGLWEEQLKLRGTGPTAPHDNRARLLDTGSSEKLRKIISNKHIGVLLDFGAFGRVHSEGGLPKAEPRFVKLSGDLRARLLAYLFQTQQRLIPRLNARNSQDSEIISAFLKGTSGSANTGTWRTLKAMLETEVGRADKTQGLRTQ